MNFSDYNFSPSDLELAQKSVKIKTFNHQKILYNDYCHGFIFVKSGKKKTIKPKWWKQKQRKANI